VQRIAELVEAKTLDGIADVRDESDRTGALRWLSSNN
jgi:DNA gyrase/topoisomerase IV subunit A